MPQLRAVCGAGEGQRGRQQQGEDVRAQRVGERTPQPTATNDADDAATAGQAAFGEEGQRGKYACLPHAARSTMHAPCANTLAHCVRPACAVCARPFCSVKLLERSRTGR